MTLILRQEFKVNSVPTDPASFTLGIVRNDTGATVVVAGTAMTKESTGVYTYTLTEPAVGLQYTVTYVVTYLGRVTTWEAVEGGGSGSTEVAQLPLTGDYLVDTLNALLIERLNVARSGPWVSYNVEGHALKRSEYLLDLDRRIAALRREIAMSNPIEEIGYAL